MDTLRTTWEVWEYDVWGNEDDGWQVNDQTCIDRELVLFLNIEHANVGTDHEFIYAYPTDEQVKDTFSVRQGIEVSLEGDDTHIYIDAADDGFPIGMMYCTSHVSLSPICESNDQTGN